MNRTLAILFAAAALGAPLAANADPGTAPGDVQRVPYADGTPVKLDCAPLYLCDITLEKGEVVSNVAIGDSVRWVLSPVASGPAGSVPHILIKPTDADLSTNMIVTTSKRTYYVDLHSSKTPQTALRVGFTYPDEKPAPTPAPTAPPTPVPVATPTPALQLDFHYAISGDKRLRPARVYNDGTRTYVELDPHVQETPALLASGPDGDRLVNYRVLDGRTYVVDGLPDKLALVIGSGKHQQRVSIAHQ